MDLKEEIFNISSSNLIIDEEEYFKNLEKIVSFIALVIIFIGLVGNITSFLIFRLNKEMKKMPSMIFLSFMCVTDTLSLFTWNLDHYLKPNFKFSIESLNIYTCNFFSFIQYFSLESSSWLLTWVSIDRYITILALPGSIAYKLPFGSIKSATVWSTIIIAFFAILNSFLLFHDRKRIYINKIVKLENGSEFNTTVEIGFRCYELSKNDFKIYIVWQNVHLVFYELIPFILMLIFNCLLVRVTFFMFGKKSSKYHLNGHLAMRNKRMKNLTMSLIVLTLVFIILTLPATILYNYFYTYFQSTSTLKLIITLIDYFTYINHSLIFINCLISNLKFRNIFFKFLSNIILKIKNFKCQYNKNNSH
jgi:hypothetical protein